MQPDRLGRHLISIHAPAKGATPIPSTKAWRERFQSTLPRRERREYLRSHGMANYFNPRSREGSDDEDRVDVFDWLYFNPRSREGSDKALGA